ncbi:MAG: hypothetical protein C5B51_32680 [Terriglobia bacterium]|nr:MAG: hypothetical protein C5B51_32680 [Terriglobia bacterium]
MQALAILFGALFTVAVCLACGRLLLRDAVRDPGIAFVSGAAILSLVVFVLCAVRIAYTPVFLGLGAVAFWLVRKEGWRPRKSIWRIAHCAGVALFAVYGVMYFVHAMAPEASPDGAAYHLSLVSRYLREHGFQRITTNIYANLSQGVEMLFLFAFAFGRHSAAALVHLAFLPALAWQMYRYSRQAGFSLAGACAAFLVFASPLVGIDAASAYNDVAVAAIGFSLFWLLQIWNEKRDDRLLLAIGILAGFAYGVKYTGVLAVPYALGYVGWKSRRVRDTLVVGACIALWTAPWLIKNWLWVHNPVSPFFNNLFPNPYVTVSFEREYRDYLSLYDLASRWQIPMQVTTYGRLSGALGPVFLLTPLGLFAARRREGRQLLLAALVFGATYFSNIGARFLIPPLPFLALSVALALSAVPALAVAIMLLHAVLSWPSIVPKYAREDAWRFRGFPWREALRLRSEESYLERRLPDYGVARLIDTRTAAGATVLTLNPIPEAYTSRRVLVEYQSAGNQVSGRILRTGAVPEYAPTLRLQFRFPRQSLTAVRVAQTATGTGLWTIHELRIFDGARELARAPAWRLRAKPTPWGIQDAFDNSPVTFWICGEPLHPGMFVEVDFGGREQADSVQIETSPNQGQARLRLEGQGMDGAWKSLSEAPQQSEQARPLGLRPAVAAELKRRGIDYLLLFDKDLGADDLRRNTARWQIREAGSYQGARLYELP